MKVWHVDAFSNRPFAGNPAAVILVDEFPDGYLMQAIAEELNLSETTFVKKLGKSHYHIRWFSPKDEAPLCAHATLAAAHVLWKENIVDGSLITFESRGGPLTASIDSEKWIHLNFPAKEVIQCAMPGLLSRALADVTVESVYSDDTIYVAVLDNCEELVNLRPDLDKIMELDCRAVCVTALNDGFLDGSFDFISRYFAPRVGIYEDPVCGSSHTRLATLWAKELNQKQFLAYQASQRGGVLKVSLENDRVIIGGQARTMMIGNLRIF